MAIEIGVQLHLPTYREKTLPELIALGRASATAGVDQLWVTDNLASRSNFVVLAALASHVRTKFGTAILGQYFRNPVEAATALMSLAELMDGRELCVGLGAGNPYTHQLIEMPRPIGFMRETVSILSRLLSGERVAMSGFPILVDYFRFNPGWSVELNSSGAPLAIFGGGNGPLGLKLAGELMDGLLLGPTVLSAMALGRVDSMVARADNAPREARLPPLRKIAEVKVSVARKHGAAREFVAGHGASLRTLSLRRIGYSDDDFRALGIDPADVDAIDAAHAAGKQFHELRDIVTDAMIDASFIAGDQVHCRERVTEIAALARRHGFEQIILSELGPDPIAAIDLLMNEVIPEAFGG